MRIGVVGAALAAAFCLTRAALGGAATCGAVSVAPAPLPVEAGQIALRLHAPAGTAIDSFELCLLDARGAEIPSVTESDDDFSRDWASASFLVRTATRIEAARYVVEYESECSGLVRLGVDFREAPPLPAQLGRVSPEAPDGVHVAAATVELDAALVPYAPLLRLWLTDESGTLLGMLRDASDPSLKTLRFAVDPGVIRGATLTVHGELLDGRALPPATHTLASPPKPPDGPAPKDPDGGKGCDCRAASALPDARTAIGSSVLFLLASFRRRRRASR